MCDTKSKPLDYMLCRMRVAKTDRERQNVLLFAEIHQQQYEHTGFKKIREEHDRLKSQ